MGPKCGWKGLWGLALVLASAAPGASAAQSLSASAGLQPWKAATPETESASRPFGSAMRIRTAPDFFLITLDGEYLSLEDLKGKVILLDFWATWCGPCRKAVPHLRKLHRKTKDAPFVIVSLSVDREEGDLLAFVEAEGMSWPQYWDQQRELVQLYDVEGFPTYVLIDHRGSIILQMSGWSRSVGRTIEAQVFNAIRNAMAASHSR